MSEEEKALRQTRLDALKAASIDAALVVLKLGGENGSIGDWAAIKAALAILSAADAKTEQEFHLLQGGW